ncbi:MAG: hypothetical protein ACTSUE_23625 [Promethearchaeota archaeon]
MMIENTLSNINYDKTKKFVTIDASPGREPLKYQVLNEQIHQVLNEGFKHIKLINVVGQRFIGAALSGDIKIEIHGTPGNDLGIFMDGPTIEVFGNVEDQAGNTMNGGNIIIHGSARDVTGLSARGGNIFVRGDGGYRCAVHIKQYRQKRPKFVFGGSVREFFGEYMAGGLLVILGLDIKDDGSFTKKEGDITQNSLATGIHGGMIIIAKPPSEIPDYFLGVGAKIQEPSESDMKDLEGLLREYCAIFKVDLGEIMKMQFSKITAISRRPFASNYCSKSL